MKTLWHRLVSRHKRLKAELSQVELEMAKDTRSFPLFPQQPYKVSTVILFAVFTFFAAIAVWISIRELIVPLLR